jgi:cephalosporin hydroxylase
MLPQTCPICAETLMTDREIIDAFHRLYYERQRCWAKVSFLGLEIQKYPTDLLIYADIIWRDRPRTIIETGTLAGGSATFMATILDAICCDGMIYSIDVSQHSDRKYHPKITYVHKDSSDQSVLDAIRLSQPCMVILDSSHEKDHVLKELRLYAPLVTKGHYLIVEDTNIHGHPVCHAHGPGPWEAIEEWRATESLAQEFVIDSDCERLLLTANPGGYLKRI